MSSEIDEKEIDISSFNSYFKKYWRIGLLLLILIFAFYLRVYHVDYPVVGYHDWKETHYLTEARNFAEEGFFKYGFFIPYVDYLDLNGDPNGVHADSFPTTSIIIGFLFSIFGPGLFLARFATILFSVVSVLFLYLFVKEISKRDDLAFLSAFLLAMNPLHVFFGRNVQLVNYSLFFMLACFYVYIKWIKTDKSKFMILTALFLNLSVLTKYSFFLMVFPMLFIFPYDRLKKIKEKSKSYLISFLVLLLIPLWYYYSDIYTAGKLNQSGAVAARIFDFASFFSSKLWEAFKLYVPDNYTWIGLVFAVIGLLILFASYRKNRFSKFVFGYIAGLPIWFLFMSGKLQGHSYHQYPLLPLFVILLAFSFIALSNLIAKFIFSFFSKKSGAKYFKYLLILVLIILIWTPSMEAKDRQFNTQFVGLDIAGDYIKEHSNPEDKIFHSTHQSHGVIWHVNRQGYNLPNSIETLEKGEENGVKWIFIYQWGFSIKDNAELWERIQDSYSLKQVAFTQNGDQIVPLYYLLEKGGSFDESKINELIKDKQVNTGNYEYTMGPFQIGYINL